MGRIGMSYSDFCSLHPDEFAKVYEHYMDKEQQRLHDSWERMRTHACIVVQPHCKKKMEPKKMLPFPWDHKKTPKRDAPESTRERFEKIREKVEKYNNHGELHDIDNVQAEQ